MPTSQPTLQPTSSPTRFPNQTFYNETYVKGVPLVRTGFREGYDANHAMYVAVNWTTLFVVKHIILLFQDMFIPYYYYKKKVAMKTRGLDKNIQTVAERDFTLHHYDDAESTLNTYGDATIFYGCYALFGSSLPMGSLLLFLQNWLKVKTDIWRHMLLYQRPHPISVERSGSWRDVMDMIAYFAVISNAAMICFTFNTFFKYGRYINSMLFITRNLL